MELKKVMEFWNEIPELSFTEKDFYKCGGCGRFDLRHGYEKESPLCIGCIGKEINLTVKCKVSRFMDERREQNKVLCFNTQ